MSFPNYKDITTNGQFYYPAWKHYARKCDVACDRCQRHNLKACIGYGDMDLCLKCADAITSFGPLGGPEPSPAPAPAPGPFMVTNMEQKQFQPPIEPLTFMLQDQFGGRPWESGLGSGSGSDDRDGNGPRTRMIQWQFKN